MPTQFPFVRRVNDCWIMAQKKRGRTYLLSIPPTEALASPIIVEQTTSEPTPI